MTSGAGDTNAVASKSRSRSAGGPDPGSKGLPISTKQLHILSSQRSVVVSVAAESKENFDLLNDPIF